MQFSSTCCSCAGAQLEVQVGHSTMRRSSIAFPHSRSARSLVGTGPRRTSDLDPWYEHRPTQVLATLHGLPACGQLGLPSAEPHVPLAWLILRMQRSSAQAMSPAALTFICNQNLAFDDSISPDHSNHERQLELSIPTTVQHLKHSTFVTRTINKLKFTQAKEACDDGL